MKLMGKPFSKTNSRYRHPAGSSNWLTGYQTRDRMLKHVFLAIGLAVLLLTGCSSAVNGSPALPEVSAEERFGQMLTEGGLNAEYLSTYVETARWGCSSLPNLQLPDDQKFVALSSYMAINGVNRAGYQTSDSIRTILESSIKVYCPELEGLIPAPGAATVSQDTMFGQTLYISGISVGNELPRLVSVAQSSCELWPGFLGVPDAERFNRLVLFHSNVATAAPEPSLKVLADPAKASLFVKAGIIFYCPQYIKYIPVS